jgi:hypothetical protein
MKIRTWFVILLLSSVAWSQSAELPLARTLPADTLVYASWAGRSLTFDGSHLGQLSQDPALREALGEIKKALAATAQDASKRALVGQAWQLLHLAWEHPIAVAVLPESQDDEPGFLLIVETGKDRKEFSQQIDQLLAQAGVKDDLKELQIGGAPFNRLPGDQPRAVLGFVGSRFVLGSNETAVAKLLAVKAETSLAADQIFSQRMKEVAPSPAQWALYVDVQGLAQAMETAKADPEMRRALVTITKGATYVAHAGCVENRNIHTRTRQFWKPSEGMESIFGKEPIAREDLDWVPRDAMLLYSARIDIVELFRWIDSIENPEAQARALPQPLVMIGQIVEDHWTLASAPSLGGLLTGTVLSVSLKDPQQARRQMAQILPSICGGPDGPARMRTFNVGDQQIHYATMQRASGAVSPSFAVRDDRLFVALWPQVLESVFSVRPEDRLVNTELFKQLEGRVGGLGCGLMYSNMRELLRTLYGPMMAGISALSHFVSKEASLVDFARMLPPIGAWSRWISPSLEKFNIDEKGFWSESYSKNGPLTGAAGVPLVAGMVSVMLPTIARARQLARIAVTKTQLKGFSNAFVLYETMEGQLPATLEDLVRTGLVHPGGLHAPLDPETETTWVDGKIQGHVSFAYVRPTKKDVPGETVLIFTKPGILPKDRFLVLQFNGAVTEMKRSKLEALLKAQNAD